jgi:hypothetical protein
MEVGEKEKDSIIDFPEAILQSYIMDIYKYVIMEIELSFPCSPNLCKNIHTKMCYSPKEGENILRNITYKCYRPSLLSKRICDEIFGEQPSLSLPPPKKNVLKMLSGMAGITTAIFIILWFCDNSPFAIVSPIPLVAPVIKVIFDILYIVNA